MLCPLIGSWQHNSAWWCSPRVDAAAGNWLQGIFLFRLFLFLFNCWPFALWPPTPHHHPTSLTHTLTLPPQPPFFSPNRLQGVSGYDGFAADAATSVPQPAAGFAPSQAAGAAAASAGTTQIHTPVCARVRVSKREKAREREINIDMFTSVPWCKLTD